MRHQLFCAMAAAMFLAASASAQQNSTVATSKATGAVATHPDLSGIWTFSIDLPGVALKKEVNGSASFKTIDQSGRRPAKGDVPGALPSTPAPSYKPELEQKVKYLFDNEAKVDKVFFCGKPGIPRIGSPRQIIQLPNEVIFLYEDISGDPYRVIPTDGRPHRDDANPSYYGDSVGHWDGDTLVVDVTNFVDDSWFGEGGYFHTSAMRVTERLWKVGDNLAYQYTVDDPNVLTQPWTAPPRVIKPSTDPPMESAVCVEDDSKRMLNLDHHGQR